MEKALEKACVVVLACLIGACSGLPQKQEAYGNFLSSKLNQEPLALDAVKLLASNFPPAQTSLEIATPRDAFGTALVNNLREKGYAVVEPAQKNKSTNEGALVLRYVVDQQSGAREEDTTYRVLLLIGKQTLTRLYTAQNGQFQPIGNWMRGQF